MQTVEDRGMSTFTDDRPPNGLGPLARTLRARWRAFALVVLVVVAAGVALAATRPRTYDATAQIFVAPVPATDAAFVGLPVVHESDPLRPVQTVAALLDDPAVAAQTARQVGGLDTRGVLHAVSVQPQGGSDVVAVTARASSPERSARLANAYAANAMQYRDALLRRSITGELATLRATDRRISYTGGSVAADVEDRIAQLERAQASGDPTLSITHAASPPTSSAGLTPLPLVLLALVFGAAAGLIVVLVLGEPTTTPAPVPLEEPAG